MSMDGQIDILVGAQWGDEGKGRWVDNLAQQVDIVARYQGGNNAGHTLYVDGEKRVLHLIPSGIFHGRISALGAQVVVDPVQLMKEIQSIASTHSVDPTLLWISEKCHVISPWHIHQDVQSEAHAYRPIGTTKRGIGPAYADRANRRGLKLHQFIDRSQREAWIRKMRQDKKFDAFFIQNLDEWETFANVASQVEPYLCDLEPRLYQAITSGKKILVEGAQGALLDVDHGTYPFVTSSSTVATAAFASLALPPKKLGRIIGCSKAYATRVGEGPFPTEDDGEAGRRLAEIGQEFGATTGRPRRCGWLDGVALKAAARLGSYDELILNKMDVLSDFAEIKLATAYRHPQKGELQDFPACCDVLAACQPVYQTFAGWQAELPQQGRFSELPEQAQAFIAAVSDYVGVPVTMVGTGPERNHAVMR